ncbi:MAG: 1,4-dihydroxy-2-naphthoate octaprenyltransferase [Marinilabiliaceae bacterium]
MRSNILHKIKVWISAFRLRTLPLSFSLVIMGTSVAIGETGTSLYLLLFTTVTTLFLQILSNLSNDYGDSVRGVDGEGRVGPCRAIQSGEISPSQMKVAIVVFAVLSLISGVGLLGVAYKHVGLAPVLTLLAVGLLCIAAAITYTVGRHPYGYAGLGDLSVFIFFGLVGVGGTYFLQRGCVDPEIVLPAVSVGLLSCGVLNMNNMRDVDNDARMGKRTIPTIIGIRNAARYQCGLMILATAGMACHITIYGIAPQYLSLIAAMPFVVNAVKTLKLYKDASYLDSQLKVISISTFAMSVIFCVTAIVWL